MKCGDCTPHFMPRSQECEKGFRPCESRAGILVIRSVSIEQMQAGEFLMYGKV
jgi:hypothetical protein